MGPVQIFSPRSVDPGAVFAGNLMGAGRVWWQARALDSRFAVRPCLVRTHADASLIIEGELDGEPFTATMPAEAGARLLGRLDPALMSEERSQTDFALLLEHALTAPLDAIEHASGRRIVFLRAHVEQSPTSTDDAYGVEARWDDIGPYPVAITGGLGVNNALLALARACPPDWSRLSPMRVAASLRFAAATLSWNEVRALAVGDAIIPDAQPPSRAHAVLVVGETSATAGQLAGDRFSLRSALIPNAFAEYGDVLMNDHAMRAGTGEEVPLSRLSDLPVRLVFELGRIEAPLSELANAGPGHVFVLPASVENGCAILSGGAVIGRGEIVDVGGQLGVRVTQLAPR